MPLAAPRGGVDYPRTYTELLSWFPNDAACVDYLGVAPLAGWLRVPDVRHRQGLADR